MRRTVLSVASGLALLLAVAPASAEVRSATVSDSADMPVKLAGGAPEYPDIKRVTANYDSAGSFSIRVEFYNSINSLDPSTVYSHKGDFRFSNCDPDRSVENDPPLLSGSHRIAGQPTVGDLFAVEGFTGAGTVQRSQSEDGLAVTVSGSSPAIANQDYRCFFYHNVGRSRASEPSPPDFEYDSECDCYFTEKHDDLEAAEKSNDYYNFFSGYDPRCQSAEKRLKKAKKKLRNESDPKKAADLRDTIRDLKSQVREFC